jgi:CheY-like chemotaxis protein
MNDLKIIREAGDKAAILVRQLLAFSRKQVLEMKVVNLNNLVDGIIKLLSRVIGEDVILDVNIENKVHNIKADASQIEQILMNLVVNARDSMPQAGRLSIETSNVELDEEYTKDHEGVLPGSYVMIAVTDTGIGMSRELQEKIFEPFYTTKGPGGTGLGLSTVYGIIRQHKGHIFVYSELEIGTTFKVYFPATRETFKHIKHTVAANELHGDETILIVDDDSSIRRLIVDTLQPLGYELIAASCAEEVLEMLDRSDQKIDLMLTDMIMPGMNGRDLAEVIKKKRPETEIVFMSGYTDEMITNHGILETGETFIQKPLSPLKLADKLRELLGRK